MILKERSSLAEKISKAEELLGSLEDFSAYIEMLKEDEDKSLLADFASELDSSESKASELELERMLIGEHDASDAILEINPGAGGTESQDWADMLLRMYSRWAEAEGFSIEIASYQPGEEAGIKSATLIVRGENAFGYLRSERGVHRLVRISPFDSNARRHTSFASVSVIPEIDDSVEVDISEDELRIDTYRSSGAGGQHVNKTDSAVRITHIPTGVVVACQSGRSQHKNKDACFKLLKARLYELEMDKKRDELESLHGERKKIDFGSQIRSYVLQPYQMVKDLRTSFETSNVDGVLDGDLKGLIDSYLTSEHNLA